MYKNEALGNGIFVTRSSVHTFGTDALLLASFAAPKNGDIICDLGAGCGIIPMLFLRDIKPSQLFAVEIDSDACGQIKMSLDSSSAAGAVHVINKDLKLLNSDDIPLGRFDLVTMNPPYKDPKTGPVNNNAAAAAARFETQCSLAEICAAASRLTNFGGRFCMCSRTERLADTVCEMRNAGLEPKRLRMVSKNKDSAPWLFLIEGKKGAKPFLNMMPGLYLYNDDGTESDDLLSVTGIYRGQKK
jgi:tRNA1Val (adenine37-N6)-methyltransferase